MGFGVMLTLMRASLSAGCLFFLLAAPVLAEPPTHFEKLHREVFVNENCQETDTCALKQFYLEYQDFSVPVAGSPARGTRMFAGYETDTVANLDRYGIAQFIRGCMFLSKLEGGRVVKSLYSRPYYGEYVPFIHPQWMIDSFTGDPLERGEEKGQGSRHLYYQWNTVRGSHDERTSKFVFQQAPTYPSIYVYDSPGDGRYFAESKEFSNTSLEFRTCLYKADEVSRSVSPNNVDFAKPIKCFQWTSSFIYNYIKGRFESQPGIDPFCSQMPTE